MHGANINDSSTYSTTLASCDTPLESVDKLESGVVPQIVRVRRQILNGHMLICSNNDRLPRTTITTLERPSRPYHLQLQLVNRQKETEALSRLLSLRAQAHR